MQWLETRLSSYKEASGLQLRMLEVGALSTQNACSKSGYFEIERIDLNSQEEGILQQDFMERPLPQSIAEKFDVISLSLVLNFVPDPQGRGEMLRRTTQFLFDAEIYAALPELSPRFPCLFLVLPAPCVTNSRYMDEVRLGGIMTSLGYTLQESKMTQRLVYYLWRKESKRPAKASFPKKELRSGSSRNNFAVVLK